MCHLLSFEKGVVKNSPFQTGHRRYADVFNQNNQDTLYNHHWGSTIRKRFLNSNGIIITGILTTAENKISNNTKDISFFFKY